jgi:predicted membrane chloride channel (bestrophin family)
LGGASIYRISKVSNNTSNTALQKCTIRIEQPVADAEFAMMGAVSTLIKSQIRWNGAAEYWERTKAWGKITMKVQPAAPAW